MKNFWEAMSIRGCSCFGMARVLFLSSLVIVSAAGAGAQQEVSRVDGIEAATQPVAMQPVATPQVMSQGSVSNAEPDSWWERYEARVTATQSMQPHWVTPLVTVTPRLEQEVRTDFLHYYNTKGRVLWNYGNGKGLELIPEKHTEIIVNVPPFFNRSNGESDGFGDISFLAKERIFSRNEEQGNGIVTVFVAGSVPTGKNGNGSCCAVVTPTLAMGKGFGQWAFTTTAGGSLPVTNSKGLGHTIAWNNTLQYRAAKSGVARLFWPEVESNTSFYDGGANDGKTASYVTAGVVIGRISLLPHSQTVAGKRLGLTLGAGEQVAVTHFNTYNHETVLTARIPF
jgi:hypothetical protein